VNRKTYTKDIPLFVRETLILYQGEEIQDLSNLINTVFADMIVDNLCKITLKPNAPSWAVDEYENWRKYHELD